METVLIDSDSDNSDNSSFGDDYEFLNIDDIANEKKKINLNQFIKTFNFIILHNLIIQNTFGVLEIKISATEFVV